MRHAYGNANSEPDGDGDGNCHIHPDGDPYLNAYANTNGNCHIHSDSDCNGNAYAITDSNGDGHIHSDGDSDGNAYANSDGNSNCHSNGDCDCTAAAYTDAAASADTAASPLAFLGIRGTRENDLASSQPPVDRLLLRRSRISRRRRAGGQSVFTSTRGFAPIAPSTSSSRKLLLYTCD